MSSLKVKRLKQEIVGNKQEEVETDFGEDSLLSKPTRHPRLTWGGTPLPLAAPPTYKRRGRASSSRHTSSYPLISGLEPFWFRASNCFNLRFRAF